MTPLEQELHNIRERTKQQLWMDKDEIRQAKELIKRARERIEYNERLLSELKGGGL